MTPAEKISGGVLSLVYYHFYKRSEIYYKRIGRRVQNGLYGLNMKGPAETRVAVSVRRLLRITVRTVTGRRIRDRVASNHIC